MVPKAEGIAVSDERKPQPPSIIPHPTLSIARPPFPSRFHQLSLFSYGADLFRLVVGSRTLIIAETRSYKRDIRS